MAVRLVPKSARHDRDRTSAKEASDAFAEAAHLAGTPLLFGLLGAWLDRMLGIGPILMLVFGGFAFAGAFVSTYLRYQARIAQQEEGKPWARKK